VEADKSTCDPWPAGRAGASRDADTDYDDDYNDE
jgi:hypothetical protein